MGLVACFFNGVIEMIAAFIAERVRRVTPRVALLWALAGIAITFISMDFTFKVFAHPLVAMLPMAVILSRTFRLKDYHWVCPAAWWRLPSALCSVG